MAIPKIVKRQLAKRWIKSKNEKLSRKQKIRLAEEKIDAPVDQEQEQNTLTYFGANAAGNVLFLKIIRHKNGIGELTMFLILEDGTTFEMPDYPNPTIQKMDGHQEWFIGDLKISILERRKRARIVYNSILRRRKQGNANIHLNEYSLEHVRFNFIYIAKTEPRLREDYWNIALKSQSLANKSCKSSKLDEFWDAFFVDSVDQWGSILGQVTLENSECLDLFLQSSRQFEWGHINPPLKKCVKFFGITGKGVHFHINLGDLGHQGLQDIQMGHMKHGADFYYDIDKLKLNGLEGLNLTNNSENIDHTIKFKGGSRKYSVEIKVPSGPSLKILGTNLRNLEYSYVVVNLFMDNNSRGTGLIEIGQPYEQSDLELIQINEEHISLIEGIYPKDHAMVNDSKDVMVTSFAENLCMMENVVGGKSASLAKLSRVDSKGFVVPEGICLTANAFEKQLLEFPEIIAKIDHLEKLYVEGKTGEDIENICRVIVNLIEKTPVIHEIRTKVIEAVKNLQSKKGENLKFAIRSSAIGEDNVETSSAGQNATFLGIRESDDVIKYITYCWASLYSHRSVEYRHQQALPIRSTMGVCIQEMVNSEVAGVMFTRHPSTGNPNEIVLTSNFGLGESVVSALVEPDTVVIERLRNGSLKIKETIIGNKSQVIRMKDSGGTESQQLSGMEASTISISNEIALQLANIGTQLERDFGRPQDVEWAIHQGIIFLIQTRPITSFDIFTEFELIHELGTGVPSDVDFLSLANVAEIMPLPWSPLGASTYLEVVNKGLDFMMTGEYAEVSYKHFIVIAYMRCLVNYTTIGFMFGRTDKVTMAHRLMAIGMSGKESIINQEMIQAAQDRHKNIKFRDIFRISSQIGKDIWNRKKIFQDAQDVVKSCWKKFSDVESFSASELYQVIEDSFHDLWTVNWAHNLFTSLSLMYQSILMRILIEDRNDFSNELFLDYSNIVKSFNDLVFSAQVPKLLDVVARKIKDANCGNQWHEIQVSKLEWLKDHCYPAYESMREFLDKYGHREVMELDVATETWGLNPEKLLSTIQLMVDSLKNESPSCVVDKKLSNNEIIDELLSPTKGSTRWKLKKLIGHAQKSVEKREKTKSLVVEVVHAQRVNYRRLAKLLCQNLSLPDESLIFFLTHDEIGKIIKCRSSELVRKAILRKRVHIKLKQNQFDFIIQGMPKPNKDGDRLPTTEDKTIFTGTVVCRGTVRGRACVLLSVENARETIHPGDILITKATDIGWTAYFPLLSGLITEIGGLISHGAVIAREYGLPCVVGVTDATRSFKTGDMVTLDGDRGLVLLSDEKNKC